MAKIHRNVAANQSRQQPHVLVVNAPAHMNKPLHKDLSFWIVAVTLVTVAVVVQVQYGVPWLTRKIQDMRPAPRVAADNVQDRGSFLGFEPALDMSKKTHPWQVPRSQPNLLETTPPQLVIIPTEYTPPSGGWTSSRPDKAMGIRVPAQLVIQVAYSWPTRRMIWTDPAPTGQFDFIANLPSDSLKALQDEIKKQWGLVAERQNLPTNAMILTVQRTNAPGLQPIDTSGGPQPLVQGRARAPMGSIVGILENALRRPVVDQTGLTGLYEVPVELFQQGASQDMLRMFNEQMGLGLTETNMVIEMLVVRKAVAQ